MRYYQKNNKTTGTFWGWGNNRLGLDCDISLGVLELNLREKREVIVYIAGVIPRNPRDFRVSQPLRPSNLSNVLAATTSSNEYWHLHGSDCRNILIYPHTTSRILPPYDTSLGSLKGAIPGPGDFVDLLQL